MRMRQPRVGQYARFSVTKHPDGNWAGDGEESITHVLLGTSTDEFYAKRDGASEVADGKADEVLLCKVIAIVKRSAQIEE